MVTPLPDHLLNPLSGWLADHTGLHFSRERWGDLNRGIAAAARDLEFSDAESYALYLLASAGSESQIKEVVRHLTIGETYFFRDQQSLAALRTHVFPQLIRYRRGAERHLRIWSAGCCTGEEAYSLAIMLQQILVDWKDWDIRILASDINSNFLQRARQGLYREWSFRGTDPDIQRRFFTNPQKDYFNIIPEIREMVTFEYFNLAQKSYSSAFGGIQAMDVILCRNVLMYFSPEQAAATVQSLYRNLAPGGWLVVSPSEASLALLADFSAVAYPGATLYKKAGTDQLSKWQPDDWSPKEGAHEAVIKSDLEDAHPLIAQQFSEIAPVGKPASTEEQARDFYALGDYASAAEILLGVLAVSPVDARALALLARVRANQGALDEAMEWCEKAIEADRSNPGAQYLMGTILQENGNFVEAAASFLRTLYLDQDFVLAHFSLGNLCQRQGKNKESGRHFKNALRALSSCSADTHLPELEGMTPERLKKILESVLLTTTQAQGEA